MANEISFSGSLSINKATVMSSAVGRAVSGLLYSMSGTAVVQSTSFLVGTSATLIPLGSLTSPHWSFWFNHDANNYLTLFNGASGAVFVRLLAGECAFLPLDPTCVPYATANTATIELEYLIAAL